MTQRLNLHCLLSITSRLRSHVFITFPWDPISRNTVQSNWKRQRQATSGVAKADEGRRRRCRFVLELLIKFDESEHNSSYVFNVNSEVAIWTDCMQSLTILSEWISSPLHNVGTHTVTVKVSELSFFLNIVRAIAVTIIYCWNKHSWRGCQNECRVAADIAWKFCHFRYCIVGIKVITLGKCFILLSCLALPRRAALISQSLLIHFHR